MPPRPETSCTACAPCPLVTEWSDFKLWPAQITAIRNLEASLGQNKPRALIQMATGSGKTYTAISFIYRLIKFGGARFITRRGLESSSARLLLAGTVLFTSRAPIGYVVIVRNPVATNQEFKSFVLKDGVLPEYIYWWLKESKQRAEALASGTTFLELSGANAKKLPIPIVPVEEQHRIVAEVDRRLSIVREVAAEIDANLKRAQALRQAVLARAFSAPGAGVAA